MLYSIANASPRNVESYGVNTLLPETIRGNAEKLVQFLDEYYNYLNSPNGPSLEINGVLLDKDLDQVSLKYLDSIQNLIASNVPNSRVLDRVSLYKIIVRYYNSRGSEDNIITLFKILFNETASIRYPKELLFEPSSSPEKSLLSHASKIQDGYYWQNFSYVVRASLDTSLWFDAFNNFMHPAGLKMFYELAVELFSPNTFDAKKIPTFNIVEDNTEWIKQLLMEYPGQHTPIYQPGWFRELLLRFLFQADSRKDDWSGDSPLGPNWPHPTTQEAYLIAALRLILQSNNSRNSLVRYDYDYNGLKFIDECTLKDSGFLNKTLFGANEPYSETNDCKFLNLSTYITTGVVIFNGRYALTLNGVALTSLKQFPGEQPLSSYSYNRPDGTFEYRRPDGTSTYKFPESPVLTFNAEPQNILLHENKEYAQFQDQDYIQFQDQDYIQLIPSWEVVTIRYYWNGSTDLDTATTFAGETVGFGLPNNGSYMTWSGDDMSNNGYENVVIDLAKAWRDGVITNTAVIQLAADWYPVNTSGPANVEIIGSINSSGGPNSFVINPGNVRPSSTSVGTLTIASNNLGFTFS